MLSKLIKQIKKSKQSPTQYIKRHQEQIAQLPASITISIKSSYGDMVGIKPEYYRQICQALGLTSNGYHAHRNGNTLIIG